MIWICSTWSSDLPQDAPRNDAVCSLASRVRKHSAVVWFHTWWVCPWLFVQSSLCLSIRFHHYKSLFPSFYLIGNGTPLQYFCLENPMDGAVWWAAVHGVAKSRTRLSDFSFTFHFHALEKEMATHSSVLAWRIPGTGEPGGLPPMGWHRVGHD